MIVSFQKDKKMMPVVRISEGTWDCLKGYARPLEDTPEDVIKAALDALDKANGKRSPAPVIAPAKTKRRGDKLPQKEFWRPLMQVLRDLGGEAEVSDIKRALEPLVSPRLSEADYTPVSTGDPRWWNAACWERNDLVKEGLFEKNSPRGIWSLSKEGLRAMKSAP